MDKELFRKVEGMLYRYYRKLQDLGRKKKALAGTEKRIAEIKKLLIEANNFIPSFGMVGNYLAVIGGKSDGPLADHTVRAYDVYTHSVDQLMGKLAQLEKRRISLKLRIMTLETEIEGIEFAISLLDPEERQIVEQKYMYQRSNLQIGMALGLDESTVRYRRQAIVEKIARWLPSG